MTRQTYTPARSLRSRSARTGGSSSSIEHPPTQVARKQQSPNNSTRFAVGLTAIVAVLGMTGAIAFPSTLLRLPNLPPPHPSNLPPKKDRLRSQSPCPKPHIPVRDA